MDFSLDTVFGLLGLQGSNGNLKAPDTRVSTAQDARALLSVLEIEDQPRSRQRALVKGMVDGHPPYDDKQRRAEGRGWECNLNFMEGQAIMNRTAVPYYNLFARVPYYVECRTAFQPDNPNFEMWNAFIQRRLHNMLKRWPDFNWNIQQISYWMRLHGIGFALPENDYSWRFRSTETGSVLVPKGSPSLMSKRIPYVFIRVPYRITELWDYIKNPRYSEEKGWNIEACKLACKYGMKGTTGIPDWWAQPWEKFEQVLKNHDLTASWSDGDIVNCVVFLVREFSKPGDYTGKISKFIFTEFKTVSDEDFNKMPSSYNGKDPKKDFLFADPNCYSSYLEGLIPFFRNTGDGTWHSVRGYAMEAFKHLEVDNRLLCQMINRAFIDSSVVMQFASERDRKRSQLSVWGTVVQMPVGAEIKQTVVQGGVQGVVQTHMVLENHLSNNLGVFQPRMLSRQDGKGEQPTARQVDYQASSEASIGEGEITIWYQQLDALYKFIFDRASDPSTPDEEAKRFQKECLEDGVPREALRDMEYVRANRQNGYGSPEMGIMKFQQGQMLVPMLPEDGKQMWLEDAVTQLYGPEKTKRYVPREHIPDDQDWEATVENQMIADGRMPVVASGQDDVIHLNVHFHDTQQTLTPPQQGQQDPSALQKEAVYASTMAQHVEQHIARLEKDPTRKKEAKMFEDAFKQLSQYSEVLWRALREAHRQMQLEAQQNQQATALSALDQAKIQSVQTGAAAAAAKAQSQMENQRAKTLQQLHLKDLKSAQDISLNRTKTAHDINLDYLTTAHDMNMNRAQTANDMAIERARELAVPEPAGNGQQGFGQ